MCIADESAAAFSERHRRCGRVAVCALPERQKDHRKMPWLCLWRTLLRNDGCRAKVVPGHERGHFGEPVIPGKIVSAIFHSQHGTKRKGGSHTALLADSGDRESVQDQICPSPPSTWSSTPVM